MVGNFRLDSHKLIFHPEAVSKWLHGENIYPIEIEISPSGACNHRCIFCAVDYVGYKPIFLKKETILRDIKFMSGKGLKSVICSGEGEPILNKDLPEIVNTIKNYGVDVAMASNGVLLTEEFVKECLSSFTWIRFSMASGEEKSYKEIHRSMADDLNKVKNNLAYAVKYKRENKLKTTLGVQCLLIPNNIRQIVEQAKMLKEIGVDYFTIKPYSKHLHSNNRFEINYEELLDLEMEVKEIETEDFKIYFRANAMQKVHHCKSYTQCLGLPFMTHIDATGEVWPCIAHLGAEELSYGNINESTFEEIWNGNRRREVEKIINSGDINKICREACRLDEINIYLDELKNPGEHVNFI